MVGSCDGLADADKTLCQAVLNCVSTSQCAAADKTKFPYRAGLPCYCGALEYTTCSNTASSADLTGDCKAEINAAAKLSTITPAAVVVQFTQYQVPLGAAMTQVNDPGLLPEGCGRLNTPADRQACQEIVACAYRTGCAVNSANQDAAECYCGTLDSDTCFVNTPDPADPGLNGACKAEIQKAAGGSAVSPLDIGQRYLQTSSPIGAAVQFALKAVDSCTDECFSH
jgi:hypothetical protein